MAEPVRENPGIAYEPTDWPLKPLVPIALGLLALLVISAFVLILAYPHTTSDVTRKLTINPPGPRLQTDEGRNLQQFRAAEEKRLNTYYWIDEQKGIVHVPIEQAMKQLVTTGIPDFPRANP
ncbi:MAG TPA: hypothetical protein VKX28_27555 [Xanthobacteraceae bacterium]|nr:hypothetical protein [Xanthobacteraceae bacterium]